MSHNYTKCRPLRVHFNRLQSLEIHFQSLAMCNRLWLTKGSQLIRRTKGHCQRSTHRRWSMTRMRIIEGRRAVLWTHRLKTIWIIISSRNNKWIQWFQTTRLLYMFVMKVRRWIKTLSVTGTSYLQTWNTLRSTFQTRSQLMTSTSVFIVMSISLIGWWSSFIRKIRH
jgi:hypothetical protein